MAYINTTTNQYPITEQDIRALYPNTSFPFPFVAPDTYTVVFPTPQPELNSILEIAIEIEPELTSKNVWEQRWEVRSRFSEYTDEQGVVHTVAQQEAAAIAVDQAAKKASNVAEAKRLLAETDFSAFVDVRQTLTNVVEFDAYRTSLRAVVIDPPVVVEWPLRPTSVWTA